MREGGGGGTSKDLAAGTLFLATSDGVMSHFLLTRFDTNLADVNELLSMTDSCPGVGVAITSYNKSDTSLRSFSLISADLASNAKICPVY